MSHDADALREGLQARIESVLSALFPEGKAEFGKFRVGDAQGTPGRSLVVEINGDKAGLWKDHATNQGGDIFNLIAASRGIDPRSDFPRVLDYARDLLGLNGKERPKKLREPLGPCTARWDYCSADGELLASVRRYDPPSGKTYRPYDAVRGVAGAPEVSPLYSLPGLRVARKIILVEGEKCARALIDAGIPATTAMGGASAPVDKTDWSPLLGKQVLIWPDHDKPGAEYARRAYAAVLAAGAASCALLLPPEDKPERWDAADAIAEGFDVEGFIASGERLTLHPPLVEGSEDPTDRTVEATEDALAVDFTRRYALDWKFVATWSKWMVWTGQRWRADPTLCAYHLIRQVCRESSLKAPEKVAVKLASSSTASGAERFARSDRRHAATTEEWDAGLWLLNCPGGEVDLRTGDLLPHRRESRITKITTATPQGDCPAWRRFLKEITRADDELQAYLRRVAGYCLTGITTEHVLFFCHGTGANGKSVFANTLAAVLHDYAATAPLDTFMETRSERHPTDLAGLRGARLVASTETEQGRRWAESKIKALTGGDKISARFMRQDFFEYTPQFKLVVTGNHKPGLRSIDEAMQRRLHLVPFTVTIPPEQRDKHLAEKLLGEADGIIAWAVQGCLEWQRQGLCPPARVVDATQEYLREEDSFGQFIQEECEDSPRYVESTASLYERWRCRAERAGEYAGSAKWLGQQLVDRGYERGRTTIGAKGFVGLRLLKAKGFDPFDPRAGSPLHACARARVSPIPQTGQMGQIEPKETHPERSPSVTLPTRTQAECGSQGGLPVGEALTEDLTDADYQDAALAAADEDRRRREQAEPGYLSTAETRYCSECLHQAVDRSCRSAERLGAPKGWKPRDGHPRRCQGFRPKSDGKGLPWRQRGTNEVDEVGETECQNLESERGEL